MVRSIVDVAEKAAASPTGPSAAPPLRTAQEAWKELLHCGVKPEKRKSGLDGYDTALAETLNRELFGKSTPDSLEANLKRTPKTLAEFLNAFFSAAKPFSEMLKEILSMFEEAGAKRSDKNLRLEVNLSEMDGKIVLTLEQFREIVASVERSMRPVSKGDWTKDGLWDLYYKAKGCLPDTGPDVPHDRLVGAAEKLHGQWRGGDQKTGWSAFPGFAPSGHTGLDGAVRRVVDLLNRILDDRRRLAMVDLTGDDESVAGDDMALALPPTDFDFFLSDWRPGILRTLAEILDRHASLDAGAQAAFGDQVAAVINGIFDSRETVLEEVWTKTFRDLLNLPIWKQRHEIYAVWVGARIAKALDHLDWTWLPDGDRLSFPFSGAQLALLGTGTGCVEFWTEKQTPLSAPGKGRTKAIQPDYRLMRQPAHAAGATRLVVECKQYARSSTKNFSAALEDYAVGCPDALVLLVNYGPISPSVLDNVRPDLKHRTITIGDFHPCDENALRDFTDRVRQVYPLPPVVIEAAPPRSADADEAPPSFVDTATTKPAEVTEAPPDLFMRQKYKFFLRLIENEEMDSARVTLRRNAIHKNLDLHLFCTPSPDAMHAGSMHVGRGGVRFWPSVNPVINLADGNQQNPSFGWLRIRRFDPVEYKIYVHHDSGDAEALFPLDVYIHVNIGETSIWVRSPHAEAGKPWWFVGTINGRTGEFTEVNTLAESSPAFDAASETSTGE